MTQCLHQWQLGALQASVFVVKLPDEFCAAFTALVF
jgi:hypothetical protein